MTDPTRRTVLLAAALAAAGVRAQAPKENRWEELMPKDWDPMAGFKAPPGGIGLLDDSDPRVFDLMRELRTAWDNAPTRAELDGQAFRLSGYLVPLEQVRGEIKEFLLVPYFGACIHSPPPPANQIVHVLPARGAKGLRSMDAVTVQGTLRIARSDTAMGASGYRLDAASVEPYKPPPR